MTQLYLSHEQRVEIIRGFAIRHDLRIFVETGTGEGFTLSRLVSQFDVCYSCEIDRGLHRTAREMFAPFGERVQLVLGDSGEWLEWFVPTLVSPTLFWLDGHYCGGPTRGEIDTPIVRELKAAVKAPKGSVILIDDARLFGGGAEHSEEFKDYPHIDWVNDLAFENGYYPVLKDDVIRLVPRVQNH